MYHLKVSHTFFRFLSMIAGGVLLWLPLVASAESSSQADHTAMTHQTPGWAEQLKGQTVVEDAMAGRPERAAMVERQHERIMLQMGQDAQTQQLQHHVHDASVRCRWAGSVVGV